MTRRLLQLFAGLVLYGISDSMLLLAGLGVDPWDVLHQGLSRRTGIRTGTWAIIVGTAWPPACTSARVWVPGPAACIGPLARIFVPLLRRTPASASPDTVAQTGTSTSP
jgi:hypothetical protein